MIITNNKPQDLHRKTQQRPHSHNNNCCSKRIQCIAYHLPLLVLGRAPLLCSSFNFLAVFPQFIHLSPNNYTQHLECLIEGIYLNLSMSIDQHPNNTESRDQSQSGHGENSTTSDSLLQYRPHSASTSTSTTLSRESVETWIESIAAACPNQPSPLPESQQGLKRKRSASPDAQNHHGSSRHQDKQSLPHIDTMSPQVLLFPILQ